MEYHNNNYIWVEKYRPTNINKFNEYLKIFFILTIDVSLNINELDIFLDYIKHYRLIHNY